MPLASARHILVDSKEECETLKQQIAGGADFADLAAEHSLCPSAQEGARWGSSSRGKWCPSSTRSSLALRSARCKGRSRRNSVGTWSK